MSILAHLFAGRYSKLTRSRRPAEITRLPEAPTVLAVLPVRDEPGKTASLTEYARPHEQTDEAERFTWHVRVYEYGSLVESKGFDVLRDAQAYLSHVTMPLPTFEPLPEVSDYADEPDTLPEACYHSAEDEAWWARHEHETPSQLDGWLDELNDAQVADLSDDFGGAFGMGGVESW